MSSKNDRTGLALIHVVVLGALALGWVPDVAAVDCDGAKTQREIEECATIRFADENAQLDRAYNGYLRALEGEDHERLVEAERAWERYRDLDCRAAQEIYAGGTMAATEFVACKTHLTAERLNELRRIYAEPPRPSDSAPK